MLLMSLIHLLVFRAKHANMIDSEPRPDSNRHPFMSLSQIAVRFKGILKSSFFRNSQICG